MEFTEIESTDSMVDVYSTYEADTGALNGTCYESADNYLDESSDFQSKQYHVDTFNGYSRYLDQRSSHKTSCVDLLPDVNVEEMPPDLQHAFRILSELLSDSNKLVIWPFLDKIDTATTKAFDYYEKIKKPMWIKKILEKFHQSQYRSITEFISDMHLMIENCYRYNGPDHPISKKASKLQVILEQKLVLLPRDIQEKARAAVLNVHSSKSDSSSMSGTRSRRLQTAYNSNWLVNQIRSEQRDRQRDQRRQQMQERKQVHEAVSLELDAWEESLLSTVLRQQLNVMWELPQIGLFLFLCSGSLNIGEVVYWEMERCMLLPRESQALRCIMTSLMSTPLQRERISGEDKTLMPYDIWEDKLRKRLVQWYKVLQDHGGNVEKCCEKIGIDDHYFRVLGVNNPLEGRKFHDLSFYQRVCMLKALCEYCVSTQEYLQATIEMQPPEDQREYVLGTDATGFTYIHFPQFCGADLRIYKRAKIEMPTLDVSRTASRKSTSRTKKSRQKASTTPKAKMPQTTTKSGRRIRQHRPIDSEESGEETDEGNADEGPENIVVKDSVVDKKSAAKSSKNSEKGPTGKQDDIVESLFTASGRQTRTSMRAKMFELMSWDDSQLEPATDAEKAAARDAEKAAAREQENEMAKMTGKGGRRRKADNKDMEVNDDEKTNELVATKKLSFGECKREAIDCDDDKTNIAVKEQRDATGPQSPTKAELTNGDCINDADHLKKEAGAVDVADVKPGQDDTSEKEASLQISVKASSPIAEKKGGSGDAIDTVMAAKEEDIAKGDVSDGDITKDVVKAVEPAPLPDVGPETGTFELVADSVEGLRLLISKLSEETSDGKKARKAVEKAVCEKELVERLEFLLHELEPYEIKLQQCNRRAKMKMMKELKTFEEECRRKETMVKSFWDSDESDSDHAGASDHDSSDYDPAVNEDSGRRMSKRNVPHKYIVSSSRNPAPVDSTELDADLGVSSWGRIRKRRLIPNNIEDQGIYGKKSRRSGDVNRDSPLMRDSPSRDSSPLLTNLAQANKSYEAFGTSAKSVDKPPMSNTMAAKYSTLRSTVFSRDRANGVQRPAVQGASSVPKPSVHSAPSAASQDNSSHHLRMSWDQLKQLGIARLPGSETFYYDPRLGASSSLGATTGAQQMSVAAALATSNQQKCQRIDMPADVVQQIIGHAQKQQLSSSALAAKTSRAAVTMGLPAMTTRLSAPDARSVDNKLKQSSEAGSRSFVQTSIAGGVKVIMPVASAGYTPSSGPIRLILPSGQNILVKQMPSNAGTVASASKMPASSTNVSMQGQYSLHRGSSDSVAPTGRNVSIPQVSGFTGAGVRLMLSPNQALEVARSTGIKDHSTTDFLADTSQSYASSSMSPTKFLPVKTVRELLDGSSVNCGPNSAASSSQFQLESMVSSSNLQSSLEQALAADASVRKAAAAATLATGFRMVQPMVSQSQSNLTSNGNLLQREVASNSPQQLLKAMPRNDAMGRMVLVSPQQLQMAIELAKKNAVIDSAIRKAITTGVITTLPTAQIKVCSAASPLDLPVRQPHRPVTVVTSATKTPLTSVPESLSRMVAKSSGPMTVSATKSPLVGTQLGTDQRVAGLMSPAAADILASSATSLHAQRQRPGEDRKTRQVISVERSVGREQVTVEGMSVIEVNVDGSGQVNAASQTRLLDTAPKLASTVASWKPITSGAVLRVANASVMQRHQGASVQLDQQNVMVNARPVLVQQQQQQQPMILLARDGTSAMPNVLPIMIGSSVLGMPIQQSGGNLLNMLPVQQSLQQTGVRIVHKPSLPTNAAVQLSPEKSVARLHPQVSAQKIAISLGMTGFTAVGSGASASNVVMNSNGTNAANAQQQYILLNVGGQLVAAPTTGLRGNQVASHSNE